MEDHTCAWCFLIFLPHENGHFVSEENLKSILTENPNESFNWAIVNKSYSRNNNFSLPAAYSFS